MASRLTPNEREAFERARSIRTPGYDINPNDVRYDPESKILFLVTTPGKGVDFSLARAALTFCQKNYLDAVCLVIFGVMAEDIGVIWEEYSDKPTERPTRNHGPYWWVSPEAEIRSAGGKEND